MKTQAFQYAFKCNSSKDTRRFYIVDQEYEQQTMFILDPSGNPIEFKSFCKESGVYHAM